MSEHTYNKETIDSKLDGIKEVQHTILAQVTKTNGRVTSLEKWRYLITGIALAATLMGIPNLSMVAKLFAGI